MDAAAFAPASWHGVSLRARGRVALDTQRRSRVSARQTPRCADVLVLNCASGGHAFLGAHLSEALLADGHGVRLLHDGKPQDSVAALYDALKKEHPTFSVEMGALPASLTEKYDVVYDNYSKGAGDVTLALQQAKNGAPVHYVSSAGAYAPREYGMAPSRVGDAAAGGTIDAEEALRSAGARGASFRPIYMYGPGSSKREYLDFFFDRIVRKRPVYIPGTGAELTSLTDVRDVAAMMAAALGKPLEASVFNAVSPRGVTLDGVAQLVASVVGYEAIVRHYDPVWAAEHILGYDLKKVFPFRIRHFFADPAEAVTELGWAPKYSGDLGAMLGSFAEAYEEYKSLGLHEKELKFDMEDSIARGLM